MIPCLYRWFSWKWLVVVSLCLLSEFPLQAQESLYRPIPIPSDNEVSDTLSERDIPTGEGGFARDYTIDLQEGEQVAIDVISDNFDAIVILLGSDGTAIAENDDGPDGTTNSLLFSRITESGKYIIRVRSFGETGNGKFTLKVTRLRPKK
ncbi:MAG: PPC domain-containing protein [Microcystaceae cyanobacterium]